MSNSVPARLGLASCCSKAARTPCAPAQGLFVRGQSPEAEAEEGFAHQQGQRQIQRLPPLPSPRAALWREGPGCAAPTAPWSSGGGGWGRCYPALGLLPGVEGLQRERGWMQKSLHQEQQEEQAGVANAESGHTVSPSKRRRRCSSAGRCNLGKMKLSIMHLSPHSPLPGWRGRALSHPMFNSMLSAPEPWLQTHPGLTLCAS